jgi:pimeloyl-ACP methyl ester carboxylesterase
MLVQSGLKEYGWRYFTHYGSELGHWNSVVCTDRFSISETDGATALYLGAARWADSIEIDTAAVIEDSEAGPDLAAGFKQRNRDVDFFDAGCRMRRVGRRQTKVTTRHLILIRSVLCCAEIDCVGGKMRVARVLGLLWMLGMGMSLAAQTVEPLLMPESKLPPVKNVRVFGQKIVYYDIGSGPVVVLVHGMASQARFDWGNVMLPLAAKHRVIALDQIGFGRSDKPLIDYSVQTEVDFLGEFLRTLQVKKFSLAGESLGGWIAALYTIEALDVANAGPYALPKPDRLILEDAAGMMALQSRSGSTPVSGTLEDARGVAIVFHDKSRVTEEYVRKQWAMKMEANDGFTQRSIWSSPKLAGEVVGKRLKEITIPTLVVWGGDDEIVPLEQGRGYAAGIDGAKLVIVPECGHAPSAEKPKEFLAAALPFLE